MSGQDFLIHVDFVARKEWIEREKERKKIEFSFKKRREEENKGKREKEKRKNQSIRAKFYPFFMTKK